MRSQQLIDEAMAATGARTHYQLAKTLGLTTPRISDYAKGKRKPDEYACTKIAIALGKDPAEVIAEVNLEWEKDEKRREFWRNFISRAAKPGGYILALIFSIFWWHAHGKTETIPDLSNISGNISYISTHYAKCSNHPFQPRNRFSVA